MGSNPFIRTNAPAPKGFGAIFKWLRSTEVVHFLGKEEVGGSIPPGASIGFSGFATYQVFAVVNMKMIE